MKGAFDLYHEPLGHHGLSSPLWPLGTHGPSWTQWVFLFPLSSSIRPSHVIPGRLLLSGPTREYGPIVELRFLEFLQILFKMKLRSPVMNSKMSFYLKFMILTEERLNQVYRTQINRFKLKIL